MVATTGPKFYPQVNPGPDPKQTRKVNDLGKEAQESRTGKLSSLEVWQGYRVFRDARSPTGWIDQHRIPVVAIDTHGHALKLNLYTGKPVYVHPTPASAGGGLLETISKVLQYNPLAPDFLGFALDKAGFQELNQIRVGAAVAATSTIIGAGGFGATTLAGLGGASSSLGGAAALLGGGTFASQVGSPVPGSGIVPVGPAPAAQPSSSSRSSGGGVLFIVLAGAAALLILSRKR